MIENKTNLKLDNFLLRASNFSFDDRPLATINALSLSLS